jgi:hypothetical protein
MANSGIQWIDVIFNWCVLLLIDTAKILGISYEEINVWLFVIAGPLLLLLSISLNLIMFNRLRRIGKYSQPSVL